ncbi:S-adenosyl-L-methionine-dependent methyltransferase [Pyrenochaeta sp. MPI-SDFR-AT-0127]|nr:S-adenosyl-L-methionine-dependent methyltransferase [Pyrenochaeta sp. MPI-SDFR-AT-0127]
MDSAEKKSLLDRVFAATSTLESRALYDEWASTYNSDMTSHEFIAPRLVAEAVARGLKLNHISTQPLKGVQIVDAGCGTGLVGGELSKLGAKEITGLDISEGMLDVARKTGVYRELKIADLTTRLDVEDGTFDALTCCGLFTHGHLGPQPLEEFVRIVKAGGVVVATVKNSHWTEKGFDAEVERLAKEANVEVVEKEVHAYRKNSGGGKVLILRKIAA